MNKPLVTPVQRAFGAWMSVSFVLYGLGGIAFAAFPRLSHSLPDQVLRRLPPLSSWEALPSPEAWNWTILSVSMMATISTCAFLAWREPVRCRNLAVPIVISKFVSSAGGLAMLLGGARHTIYLAIPLVDFPLGLITLILWSRLRREESP